MHPPTIIELILLRGIIIAIGLIGLVLSKKVKKFVWVFQV